MSIDLNKDLDYEPIVEEIIRKTKAGKIDWEATADPDVFIAAVKGEQSFVLARKPFDDEGRYYVHLVVKGTDAKVLFEVWTKLAPRLNELHSLAARVAHRIDERIESTFQLLRNL